MPRVGSSPQPLPLALEGLAERGQVLPALQWFPSLPPEMCRRRQGAAVLPCSDWAPEMIEASLLGMFHTDPSHTWQGKAIQKLNLGMLSMYVSWEAFYQCSRALQMAAHESLIQLFDGHPLEFILAKHLDFLELRITWRLELELQDSRLPLHKVTTVTAQPAPGFGLLKERGLWKSV